MMTGVLCSLSDSIMTSVPFVCASFLRFVSKGTAIALIDRTDKIFLFGRG